MNNCVGDNLSPFLSVIIPLYNKERTIRKTINTVLNQDYKNFELIIVDDGSKDDSIRIASTIQDKRIHIISQQNAGVSKARNNGVSKASGDYVIFLDADDVWYKNHLTVLVGLINDYGRECDVFTTNFSRIFPDGEEYVNRNDLTRGIIPNYFKASIKGDVTCSSCVCIRRTSFHKIGGFNPKYTHGEDTDLWNRMGRKYQYAYSPEVTCSYLLDQNASCSTMNYNTYSAKDALKNVSTDPYDIMASIIRYLKYCVKKLIGYKGLMKKPHRK